MRTRKKDRAVLILFSAVLMFSMETVSASVQDMISGFPGNSSVTETAVFLMNDSSETPGEAAGEAPGEAPGDSSGSSRNRFDLLYFIAAEGDDDNSRPFLGILHLQDTVVSVSFRDSLSSAGEVSDARRKRIVRNSLERLLGRRPDYIYIDDTGAAEKLLTVVKTLAGTGKRLAADEERFTPELWEAFMAQTEYFADEQIFSRMAYIFTDDVPERRIRQAFSYLSELYRTGIETLHIPAELDQEGYLLYEGSMMRLKLDQLRYRLNQ